MTGNLAEARRGVALPGQAEISGLNLMSRWVRALDDGASATVSAYYDRTERDFPGSYHETLDIVDLQVHHSFAAIGAHSPAAGASYRYSRDRMDNGATLAFLPPSVHQGWASLFVQDELQLGERLRLSFGARLEHNDYTGLEVLPNARIAWNPAAGHLLWSSLSRAVRAPSRIDRDFYAPAKAPFLLVGNTTFLSEVARVLEVGYRGQPAPAVSLSATAFLADYDKLRSLERSSAGAYTIGNLMEGSTSGIEAWGAWQATPDWHLSAGWTVLQERLHLKPGSVDPTGTSGAGNDPSNSWQLRSAWNCTPGTVLDVTLRHVGALPRPAVPAYHALDARLGWQLRPDLEVSLGGQNLFAGQHAEFGAPLTRSAIGPRAFLRLLWRP